MKLVRFILLMLLSVTLVKSDDLTTVITSNDGAEVLPIFEKLATDDEKIDYALLYASRNNAAKLTFADDFNLLSVEQLIAEQAKPSGKRQTRSLFGKLKGLAKEAVSDIKQSAQETVSGVKEVASSAAQKAKETAKGAVESAKEKVQETKEKVKEKAEELNEKAQEKVSQAKETIEQKATDAKEFVSTKAKEASATAKGALAQVEESLETIISKNEPAYWKKIKGDSDVQKIVYDVKALAGSTKELNAVLATVDTLEKQQELVVEIYRTINDWLTTNPRMLSRLAPDRIDALKQKAREVIGQDGTEKLSKLFDRLAVYAKGEKLVAPQEEMIKDITSVVKPAESEKVVQQPVEYSEEELDQMFKAFAKPL